MTRALRRYLAIEITVAAAISAVLSIAFALLLFGKQALTLVAGSGGLILDAVPPSAIIALMSSFVPTLLTRRRVAAGAVARRPGRIRRPRRAGFRALIVGVVVGALGGIAHAALLPLGPPRWGLAAVLVYKPVYGALLGAGVAGWAVIAALADPVATGPAGSGSATDRRGA